MRRLSVLDKFLRVSGCLFLKEASWSTINMMLDDFSISADGKKTLLCCFFFNKPDKVTRGVTELKKTRCSHLKRCWWGEKQNLWTDLQIRILFLYESGHEIGSAKIWPPPCYYLTGRGSYLLIQSPSQGNNWTDIKSPGLLSDNKRSVLMLFFSPLLPPLYGPWVILQLPES